MIYDHDIWDNLLANFFSTSASYSVLKLWLLIAWICPLRASLKRDVNSYVVLLLKKFKDGHISFGLTSIIFFINQELPVLFCKCQWIHQLELPSTIHSEDFTTLEIGLDLLNDSLVYSKLINSQNSQEAIQEGNTTILQLLNLLMPLLDFFPQFWPILLYVELYSLPLSLLFSFPSFHFF